MAIKKSFTDNKGMSYDYHRPSGAFGRDASGRIKYEIESYKNKTTRNNDGVKYTSRMVVMADENKPANLDADVNFITLFYQDMKGRDEFENYEDVLEEGQVIE